MALWAKRPDDPGRVTSDGRKLSTRGARHPAPDETWIEVTGAMAADLRHEIDRTGLAGTMLLRGWDGTPPGLTRRIVQGWLYGHVKTTNAAHWSFVIERLRALPDGEARPPAHRLSGKGWQEIGADDLAELRAHRERPGIGGAALLRNAHNMPSGVTPSMISGWLSGAIKTARPEYVAYVLSLYRALS